MEAQVAKKSRIMTLATPTSATPAVTDPLAQFPAVVSGLSRYDKQAKTTKCKTCGLGGFVWYEDRTVTKPRGKKWYLLDSSGNRHEHEKQTSGGFLVTLTYRVKAKTEAEARSKVEKWSQDILSVDPITV